MPKQPCVYILASRRNGTIYVGVTSDLLARLYRHREGLTRGFAAEHDVLSSRYYEMHESMADAIAREKRLKNWRRGWKVALIEEKQSVVGGSGAGAWVRSSRAAPCHAQAVIPDLIRDP